MNVYIISMEMEEFRHELISDINENNDDQESRREAYLGMVVNDLTESNEAVGFDGCRYNGKAKNGRDIEIDGYHYDEDDGTLCVYICRYIGGDEAETLTRAEIEHLLSLETEFINSSFDGTIDENSPENSLERNVADFIELYREKIQRFRLYIITDKVQTSRTVKNLSIDLDGKNAQISIFDIRKYFELVSNSKDYESSEIELEDYGYPGISCIKADTGEESGYEAYLSIIPGKVLSEIYDKYGFHLLEANVRSYLNHTTKINRGIRGTIVNEPGKFFAYNNGITATCSDLEISQINGKSMITKVKSLQIVNGCQTMASIHDADANSRPKIDVSSVMVPLKIIKIGPEHNSDLTMKISNYSNSQNKLSDSDFFSNSPFHIKIERISKRLDAPAVDGSIYSTKWYYERARGSYLQEQSGMTPAERRKFRAEHPKNQCITKTDLAKYRNTFEMRPQFVSKGTQKNMKKFAETVEKEWSNTKINGASFTDNYYKETVAMAIIFKNLEKAIMNPELAPWYQNGYRANIVTYSIAKLVYEFSEIGASIDYLRIWADQRCPECIRDQLLSIGKLVLEKITAPSHGDVREFCKKDDCWTLIKGMEIDFHPEELKPYLKSTARTNYERRVSSRQESDRGKMNARITVVNLGNEFWKKAASWAAASGGYGGGEIYLLNKGAEMGPGNVPTEYDAVKMLKILEKMEKEGFQ